MEDLNTKWASPKRIKRQPKIYSIGCRVTEEEQKEFFELMEFLGFDNQTAVIRYLIGESIKQNCSNKIIK